jgi:hypothetical protein
MRIDQHEAVERLEKPLFQFVSKRYQDHFSGSFASIDPLCCVPKNRWSQRGQAVQ